MVEHSTTSALAIRTAKLSDATAIWKLVDDCDSLDKNSCYAYLLLVTDFADTCLVAYHDDRLMGFVAGYVPPSRPDVVFVWQIGVDRSWRGRGVARQLLNELVKRATAGGARYMEATVTPSNKASRRLFHSLAKAGGWGFEAVDHFAARDFAGPEHEAEELIRIGPLSE